MEKDYLEILKLLEEELEFIKRFKWTSKSSMITLQAKVKGFTGNIESVLDYSMYYFYQKVYRDNFINQSTTQKEIDKKDRSISFKTYFKTIEEFDKKIDLMFPNIKVEYPGIYNVIYSLQDFNFTEDNPSWIKQANKMTNEYKHRKLALIETRENAYIEHMELPNGDIFKNNTFINNKHSIVINGIPLDETNAKSLGVKNFKGKIEKIYVFDETQKSAYETLKFFYDNVKFVILKLDSLFDAI